MSRRASTSPLDADAQTESFTPKISEWGFNPILVGLLWPVQRSFRPRGGKGNSCRAMARATREAQLVQRNSCQAPEQDAEVAPTSKVERVRLGPCPIC